MGQIWLDMYYAPGEGSTHFEYGFETAPLNNVLYRDLTVVWWNWNGMNGDSFTDSGWMNDWYYSATNNASTGFGNVAGDLWGYVLLWWGGQCTFGPVSSNILVG